MPTGDPKTPAPQPNSPAGLIPLPPIEVFRAGDYGTKGAYTAEDLAAIASEYSVDKHHAPVTHDHRQDGPADGWVRSVTARGDRLFAELDVTADMADAIRQGKFRKRSIELYRAFEGSSRPYLKAVSFLGAMIPHVKGMPDPVFADGPSELYEFGEPPVLRAQFLEEPPPPVDAKHGIITYEGQVASLLEHWHHAYLDDDGNGYTSGPVSWKDGEIQTLEADRHQHIIQDGTVLPAKTSWGVEHTHEIYLPRFSEPETHDPNFQEPKTMPKQPDPKSKIQDPATPPTPAPSPAPDPAPAPSPAPAPVAFSESKFAEMEAELAAIKKKNAELERKSAQAEFSEKWSAAVGRGAIIPAGKAKAEALFHALREKADGAEVTFGEGNDATKKSLHAGFLTFLDSLQAPPPQGTVFKDGGTPVDPATRERVNPDNDPSEFAERELVRAQKYAKEHKCSLEDAFSALAEEDQAARRS